MMIHVPFGNKGTVIWGVPDTNQREVRRNGSATLVLRAVELWPARLQVPPARGALAGGAQGDDHLTA